MMRYAIIILAIVAGVSVGFTLAKLSARRRRQTDYVDATQQTRILPWIVGLIILLAGVAWLAYHDIASSQQKYHPARIEDGKIIPPYFENGNEQ